MAPETEEIGKTKRVSLQLSPIHYRISPRYCPNRVFLTMNPDSYMWNPIPAVWKWCYWTKLLATGAIVPAELELELILTHMTQKPMLRVGEGGKRANSARTKKQGPCTAAATRQPTALSVFFLIKGLFLFFSAPPCTFPCLVYR